MIFRLASISSVVQNVTDTEAHMAARVTCALYDGCALCRDRLLKLSMPCLFMVILICVRGTARCTVHPKVFNDKALLRANGNLVTRPAKGRWPFFLIYILLVALRRDPKEIFLMLQSSMRIQLTYTLLLSILAINDLEPQANPTLEV